MKRILTIAMVVAGSFILAGSALAATKTSSVAVSATIAAVCNFQSAPAAVAFTLDPSIGGNVLVTNNVVLRCSNTTAYALTSDSGLYSGSCAGSNCMATGGVAPYINYSIALSANPDPAVGTGSGMAVNKTIKMDATVLNADYVNAAPGAYSDTMVLTITY